MDEKNELGTHFRLFRLIGFYQMVDPNGPKIFGYSAHGLFHLAMLAFTSACTFVGLSGIVYRPDHGDRVVRNSFANDMQTLFYTACVIVGNLKLITTVRNADTIRQLLTFVDRRRRRRRRSRDRNDPRWSNVLPLYVFLFASTALAWVATPIVANLDADADRHETNVINFRYPFAADTYDRFYGVFFVVESVMASYTVFELVVFDVFLIALLQSTSSQYEAVSSAYESLKCELKDEDGKPNHNEFSAENFESEFIAITSECQHIYECLKVTYKITRPIVLVYMLEDAIGMISLPYIIVMCYKKNGSSIYTSDVMTFLWTLFVVGFQSYMYCSLFQQVNERKEAINFGLYSCNWTLLNIHQKKLILLAMQTNNANRLKMNVTQTKHIDLPMLASILRSSYSITSVMIKSDSHK